MIEKFDLEHLRRMSKDKDKQGRGYDCCDCGDDLAEAADEIERLLTIVDRLPKTSDGIPVVPGDELWLYTPTPGVGFYSLSVPCQKDYCWCSTREAAKQKSDTRYNN